MRARIRLARCGRCGLRTVRSREVIGQELAWVATDAEVSALEHNPGDDGDARASRNAHALGWIDAALERLAVELQSGCCQLCAHLESKAASDGTAPRTAPALGVA